MIIENIHQLLEHIETDKKAEELVDYINNLQIKNKRLEDLLHKANDEVISYTNCCIDLKEKIDKAINYIKNKLDEQKEEQKDLPFQLVDVDYTNLLKILGDKE